MTITPVQAGQPLPRVAFAEALGLIGSALREGRCKTSPDPPTGTSITSAQIP